jgi:hypothetical protein
MINYPLPPSASAPPPPAPPGPPIPPPKAPNSGMRLLIVIVVGLVVAFMLVVLLGAITVLGTNSTTTTLRASASDDGVSYASPATTTRRATTTTAPDYYVPTPADIDLEVVEVRRACFGSYAGCNVTVEIIPSYDGPPTDPSESFTVIYELQGVGVARTGNITIQGDQYRGRTELLSSVPEGTTLSAEVTRIT